MRPSLGIQEGGFVNEGISHPRCEDLLRTLHALGGSPLHEIHQGRTAAGSPSMTSDPRLIIMQSALEVNIAKEQDMMTIKM